MIRQSLNIAASQQLQLTPKLQQAIHMLQLSTQELTQEIQTIMESNIMLETQTELEDNEVSTMESESNSNEESANEDSSSIEDQSVSIGESGNYEEPNSSTGKSGNEDSFSVDEYRCANESLQDYLMWQLEISHASLAEKIIGEAIIDSINEDGFLEASLPTIQESLVTAGQFFSLEKIEAILHLIQSFDPTGVGARNVNEALLLQLNAMPMDTPGLALAKNIVNDHLQLLAEHHYPKLKRACKTSKEQLEKAVQLIQRLNPRPGNIITLNNSIDNVIPDLIVQKINKKWIVSLRNDALPKLQINNHYVNLLNHCSEPINQQLINSHLQEARWLIKCLHNRNETLLKVAVCIVKYQKGFLEYGPGAMKPLVLRDIAEDLGMHQSTVSRITSRKYIQTPQGTYELKHFFSSHVKTSYGRTCSSMAIRTYIQEMIKQEDSYKPLSDEALAKKLLSLGIQVARRTITKYREAMGISPANKRKKLLHEIL